MFVKFGMKGTVGFRMELWLRVDALIFDLCSIVILLRMLCVCLTQGCAVQMVNKLLECC